MLHAGWAVKDITPPAGIDLSGFGGRAGPNEGVHDPLAAKALCLTDGAARFVLVTADLIGLDAATVAEVRARVSEQLGPEAPAVMIACSHTHSGPATPCLPHLGVPDAAYMAGLKQALVDVIAETSTAIGPAAIGVGQAYAQAGINRRQRTGAGAIVLGLNPEGESAPYVDILQVRTDRGRAVLFSHAAHPVTLGGDNLLVTGDWPGYAQRLIESKLADGSVAMFAQGCCGNINSDPRGSFEVAEAQGERMAEAVVGALSSLGESSAGEVAAGSVMLDLPLDDPPPADEARALLAQAEEELAAHAETDTPGGRTTREGLVAWAERLVGLAERGATGLTQAFEVQALRVGDTAIVGLPGEVFVEYQRQIKECSPFAHTFVFAYANGNIGYLPTADAFPHGGYEVTGAIRYYGTTMLTPDCERMVVGGACELLERLR